MRRDKGRNVSATKAIIGVAMLLLSVPAGYALFMVAFFASGGIFGDCGVNEVNRSKSPDGQFEALVYMHDCGATTRATWRVALAYSDDPEDFEDVFGGDVRGPLRVHWTGAFQFECEGGCGLSDG